GSAVAIDLHRIHRAHVEHDARRGRIAGIVVSAAARHEGEFVFLDKLQCRRHVCRAGAAHDGKRRGGIEAAVEYVSEVGECRVGRIDDRALQAGAETGPVRRPHDYRRARSASARSASTAPGQTGCDHPTRQLKKLSTMNRHTRTSRKSGSLPRGWLAGSGTRHGGNGYLDAAVMVDDVV